MKKMMLWGVALTMMSTQVLSEGVQSTQNLEPSKTLAAANNTPTTQPAPSSAPLPVIQQPTPAVSTTTPQTATQINCDYKIPADTKKLEPSLITTWSEKAVLQSFDFNPTAIDAQLVKLKSCFTEQGWAGFSNALKKSGNVEAIKTQKLSVSSQVMGQSVVTDTKDNQWKVTVPLQVVYQNDKDKATQVLNVDIVVSRKPSGDLGIIQMIATPKSNGGQKMEQKAPATTTPAAAPATTSTTNTKPGSVNPGPVTPPSNQPQTPPSSGTNPTTQH